MKQTIRLTESELREMIQESVRRAINESWELDQMNHFIDKENGEYDGTNPCGGKYNIGDKVYFKCRNNEIHGVIVDVDYNDTTFDIIYDVKYDENGRSRKMLGVPEDRIQLENS